MAEASPARRPAAERPGSGGDESARSPAGADGAGNEEQLKSLLRPALALVANITVLTALLVYFGWRRSETQTRRLGFDESVFGSGTRDYVLRSVRPVLVILVGVAVAALAWVAMDRRIRPYVRAHPPASSRRTALILRLLSWAWLVLPALVWTMGFLWPTQAYLLLPASIGAGVLLLQYATDLRPAAGDNDRAAKRRTIVGRAATALIVGVCLFWTASNYAEVEGVRLARSFVAETRRLPGVTVSSRHRLHLNGPGVFEEELGGGDDTLRYRYRGLRLLEYAGGRFFLISDGWSPGYGVVFLVRDSDASVRVDFVRDLRPEDTSVVIRPVTSRSDPPCGTDASNGPTSAMFVERKDGREVACHRVGPRRITADGVAGATARPQTTGGWLVALSLTGEGAMRLQAMRRDVGADGQIAVVVDGEFLAAPRLADSSVPTDIVITGLDEPTARRLATHLQPR